MSIVTFYTQNKQTNEYSFLITIGFLCSWILSMVGPIKCILIGGILVSFGLIASSLSQNIVLVVLPLGILTGMSIRIYKSKFSKNQKPSLFLIWCHFDVHFFTASENYSIILSSIQCYNSQIVINSLDVNANLSLCNWILSVSFMSINVCRKYC